MVERIGKAVVAVVVLVAITVFQQLSGDHRIDPMEWVQIATALATAAGVYLIPLAPQAPWTKTALAVVLSLLQIATTVVLGGWDFDEIVVTLITVAGALGIAVAPATSPVTRTSVGWGADRVDRGSRLIR
jgi:hypothetical protein